MFCSLLGQDIRCAFTGTMVLWYLKSLDKKYWVYIMICKDPLGNSSDSMVSIIFQFIKSSLKGRKDIEDTNNSFKTNFLLPSFMLPIRLYQATQKKR